MPTPSVEQKSLATKLAAATTHEQDSLLDQAPPALFEGRGLRDALVRIGYDDGLRGDYPLAEKVDRTIIRIGQRRHDPAMIAVGQTLGGGVLREAGDYNAGLAMFQEALAYYDRDPKPSVEKISVCQGLGITYLQQGNFRRALTNLERALGLARAMHDPRGIVPALNSLGELFRTQGQPERALDLYEQARHEVGDDSAWNMAFIFDNIGMAYEAMGETAKAIENINRSRVVAEKVNFRPRVATALAVLGQMHLGAGELAAAAQSYQESLDLSRELHDKAAEARALVGLAQTLRAQKQSDPALADANEAIKIYRDVQAHDALIDAQTEAGRCLLSLGKKEEAAAAFGAAIDEVENLRGQVVGGAEESERFFEPRIAPITKWSRCSLTPGNRRPLSPWRNARADAPCSTFWTTGATKRPSRLTTTTQVNEPRSMRNSRPPIGGCRRKRKRRIPPPNNSRS